MSLDTQEKLALDFLNIKNNKIHNVLVNVGSQNKFNLIILRDMKSELRLMVEQVEVLQDKIKVKNEVLSE